MRSGNDAQALPNSRVNLRQLGYFVRVAELGSFSKAAQALNIALSRQVRLLETSLRVTLLRRHGRGVGLTDAGQDMVCAGYGYAVLTASAAAVSGRGAELAVSPIVEPAV